MAGLGGWLAWAGWVWKKLEVAGRLAWLPVVGGLAGSLAGWWLACWLALLAGWLVGGSLPRCLAAWLAASAAGLALRDERLPCLLAARLAAGCWLSNPSTYVIVEPDFSSMAPKCKKYR